MILIPEHFTDRQPDIVMTEHKKISYYPPLLKPGSLNLLQN